MFIGIMDEDLEYIDFLGEDEEEKEMIQTIKIALFNNLAACYISMNDLKSARSACDEALLLDPSQVKALFRRAKAWTSDINSGFEEIQLAVEDLKKALELAPNDSGIRQALVKAKEDLVKAKASSKSFKGMFHKPSKNTPEENNSLSTTQPDTPKEPEAEKSESPSQSAIQKPTENPPVEVKKEEEIGKTQPVKPVVIVKEKEEEKQVEAKKPLEQNIPSVKAQENKQETVKKGGLRLYEDKDVENMNPEIIKKEKEKAAAAASKPDDIKEIEEFLVKRGTEMLRFYESTGNRKGAEELKENLRQAMAAKQRIEKISSLDFQKPNDQLKEEAERFGLDLSDPLVREELIRVQKKHMQDLKNWLMGVGPQQKGTKTKKTKPKEESKQDINTAEEASISQRRVGEEQKEDVSEERITEVSEKEKNSKSAKMLNFIIIIVAVGLFLMTLYMQKSKTTSAIPNRINSYGSIPRDT